MKEKFSGFFRRRMTTTDGSDHDPIPVATCALLLEMAHADSEFSDEEKNKIIEILKAEFNLLESDAVQIMQLADEERKESHDLWQFTALINTNFTPEEKYEMLEILWSVIYVDGHVDKHEEYLMRKLQNLLNLDHSDMIAAKINARERMEGKP